MTNKNKKTSTREGIAFRVDAEIKREIEQEAARQIRTISTYFIWLHSEHMRRNEVKNER